VPMRRGKAEQTEAMAAEWDKLEPEERTKAEDEYFRNKDVEV
jgi:hypothetical protein